MKAITHFLQWMSTTLIIGMLAGVLMMTVAIAPAQADIRQLEEAPGQIVYQSRQILKDQQGSNWQAIAFKRTSSDHGDEIYLRLVGFPGTTQIDHARPLTITSSMGMTLTAADISSDIFTDPAEMKPDVGQYDLQPILMELELAIPLQLLIPTLDPAEILLNVSPHLVEEWQSLAQVN
ncbi:MAG: DUF3122 domain-containing protein [Spirulina sp. DLM2.Bin59]|nr:MAG: DUF3122 domain-containing protein [Spirulina sp. DLM2.Bin59]